MRLRAIYPLYDADGRRPCVYRPAGKAVFGVPAPLDRSGEKIRCARALQKAPPRATSAAANLTVLAITTSETPPAIRYRARFG